MRQKSGPEKQPAEDAIRDIRRATRRHFSAEEKIRIVLEGLRGEESIAELCQLTRYTKSDARTGAWTIPQKRRSQGDNPPQWGSVEASRRPSHRSREVLENI
jgi:transposase-like protein